MRRFFFFFNAPAPTELYTLSLHDALPIWRFPLCFAPFHCFQQTSSTGRFHLSAQSLASALWCGDFCCTRSEEHTSELQSHSDLVCRLLLEKKKKTQRMTKRRINKD